MIISEFLPNPVGKDTDGEFIELFNDGLKPANLSGWKIKDASGKIFTFGNQTLGAGQYLALSYKTTKITLNNDAETLYLYDASGKLVDKAAFSGTAPEGKSFVRENNQFVLTSKPTPGKVNILDTPTSSLASAEVLQNSSAVNINPSINFNNLWIGFSIALILAGAAIFILKEFNETT